jgi:hypothetical protein
MMDVKSRHKTLTAVRSKAYAELFGGQPSRVLSPRTLFKKPDERFLIDIFVYTLTTNMHAIEAAVTNGMSDQRMVDPDDPHRWCRRELVQYFPTCTEGHARRLHDMAWLPLFDGFLLDSHHTIAWEHPAVEGTPWKHAFFLAPIINSHRDFVLDIEGDPVTFLWHIPISDKERAYKQEKGANALIDRLEAANLPWVFDESSRPPLVE